MDRSDIVAFQTRISEARDVLEDSNKRQQYDLEAAIANAATMIAQVINRHAEITTANRICWEEQQRLADLQKQSMLEYLEKRQAHDQQRLAALRAMPAPKLVVNE